MLNFDLKPKRPRTNSSLDLHNELTINLFNRFSKNLKISVMESSKGICMFGIKLNPDKYDQKDTMMAIAQIIKFHMPDLNNSKIGPFFNMLMVIVEYLVQDIALMKAADNDIFKLFLDYSSENPVLNIHGFKDPGNSNYLVVSVSFKISDYGIDVTDRFYECFFSGKDPNHFLKYLNFCLYHLCN